MGDITHLFDLVRRNDRATTELSCVTGVLIDVAYSDEVLRMLTSLVSKRLTYHFRPWARDQVENGNGTR